MLTRFRLYRRQIVQVWRLQHLLEIDKHTSLATCPTLFNFRKIWRKLTDCVSATDRCFHAVCQYCPSWFVNSTSSPDPPDDFGNGHLTKRRSSSTMLFLSGIHFQTSGRSTTNVVFCRTKIWRIFQRLGKHLVTDISQNSFAFGWKYG